MQEYGETPYLPWYKIIWNCIWILPYMAARVLACGIILCWHGPKTAKELWNNMG